MKNNYLANIIKENPVFLYLFGIVPVLGTTVFLEDALFMGLATFFVLVCSSLFISTVRAYIKPQIELIIYVIVASFFTTMVNLYIQTIDLEIYDYVKIYIPLILVNCLIMNELSVCASHKNIMEAFKSSIKSGIYFIIAILLVALVREFLGRGAVLGYILIPADFPKLLIMQTSVGGFFTLAFFCWLANLMKGDK